jgi:hypothetical protein
MSHTSLAALFFGYCLGAAASGHGPVFGMTTPTNAKGGWSFDTGLIGRAGLGNTRIMLRAMLAYGVTEDLQVSLSVPCVFSSAPLAPARITGMMPASADLEAIGAYRFFRQGPRVGTRIESTAYAGMIVPGLQRPLGMLGTLHKAPGLYTALSTGIASRSHYVWGGVGNMHFAERLGDRRPNTVAYSAVWGYRPPPFQKEYPHWDWRMFAEMSGDSSSKVRRAGQLMPGTGGHQVFVGPTALGIFRNYAIEGGIQFPVYRNVAPMQMQERYRFALNFSRFF